MADLLTQIYKRTHFADVKPADIPIDGIEADQLASYFDGQALKKPEWSFDKIRKAMLAGDFRLWGIPVRVVS